jgi:hypothetical protein
VSITSFLPTGGSGLPTGAGRSSARRVRTALRAGTVAALTSAPLLAAGAALAASNTYDGEDSGPGLTILQTIGIFVCIPVGLFLLITFLVLAPGWFKGDSHRREVGWSGQAQPAGAAAAVAKSTATAGPKAVAKKAASPSSINDAVDSAAAKTGAGASTGGASGTWQN